MLGHSFWRGMTSIVPSRIPLYFCWILAILPLPSFPFIFFSNCYKFAIISDANNSFLKKNWTFCLDCLWIASKHQLEFRCTLVSKNTRSYIGIFFWWKNWHLQYWGISHCLIYNYLFFPNIWFFWFSIKGSVASNGM